MSPAAARLLARARARAQDRLESREHVPLVDLFVARREDANRERAGAAAAALAAVVGVDVGYLRLDERIEECLGVGRDEVEADVASLFDRLGIHEAVQPFAFSLLDLVERKCGEDPSRLERPMFQPLPATEDEWVHRILRMTVFELLSALY